MSKTDYVSINLKFVLQWEGDTILELVKSATKKNRVERNRVMGILSSIGKSEMR